MQSRENARGQTPDTGPSHCPGWGVLGGCCTKIWSGMFPFLTLHTAFHAQEVRREESEDRREEDQIIRGR